MTTVEKPASEAYNNIMADVLRLGNWLMSSESDCLTQTEWDVHYSRYRTQLAELRELAAEEKVGVLR
jgi:hypothetical protein